MSTLIDAISWVYPKNMAVGNLFDDGDKKDCCDGGVSNLVSRYLHVVIVILTSHNKQP